MQTCFLRVSPSEVVRLLRAEIAAEGGQPELYIGGRSDFLIEEEFDRRAYRLGPEGIGYDLVTAEAEVNIEPRVEHDYWMLTLVYSKVLGPQRVEREAVFFGGELTLEEFAARFLTPDDGAVRVRLGVQTPQAREHFDRWWAELNARHPVGAGVSREADASTD